MDGRQVIITADGWHMGWRNDDKKFHSVDDMPSQITIYGTRHWHKDGIICRRHKPAIVSVNSEVWIHDGICIKELFRIGAYDTYSAGNYLSYHTVPCVSLHGVNTYSNGSITMNNGLCTYYDETTVWRKDGEAHRDINDEPAVKLADGSLLWMHNGKLYRDGDKPAAVFADGIEVYVKNESIQYPSTHKLL